jgi:hypothetical protein
MASSSIVSACVTRILALSNFPPELKTRDIQAAFTEWESERGGFKIKWVDDTSLLLVFADATTAKRAYLSTLLSPPHILTSPTSVSPALIKPYDGPDAQAIIQAVNSRRNHANSASRASISVPNGSYAHNRQASTMSSSDGYGSVGRSAWKNNNSFNHANGNGSAITSPINITAGPKANAQREPSPTLPSLPAHPTLNSLITSSLSDHALSASPPSGENGTPPKVGDPAKRMVGAALGIRHPGITSKGDHGVKDVQKGLTSLTIAE